MKRLQRFIDRAIDPNAVKDEALLSSLGIQSRYVPETLEDFDEMEFGLGRSGGRTIIFTLVLEHAKLKRVSLGWIPEGGDEDDMRAFSGSELAEVMDENGDTLVGFFDKVTVG
jgi:hypothetical protein